MENDDKIIDLISNTQCYHQIREITKYCPIKFFDLFIEKGIIRPLDFYPIQQGSIVLYETGEQVKINTVYNVIPINEIVEWLMICIGMSIDEACDEENNDTIIKIKEKMKSYIKPRIEVALRDVALRATQGDTCHFDFKYRQGEQYGKIYNRKEDNNGNEN